MKINLSVTALLCAACVGLPVAATTTTTVSDDFTFYQTYSIAPNFHFDNPAWLPYVQNLRESAASGFTTGAGDTALPSYFDIAPQYNPLSNAVVTDATGPGLYVSTGARKFNSWRGQADPGTVFGPAFADQYGSHIFSPYVFVVDDISKPVTLNTVVRNAYSTAQNGGATPYITFTYNNFTDTRIGVTSFGADGVLGGGDDTFINDGSSFGSAEIIAFIATGSGVAFQMSQQYDGTTPWDAELDDSEIFDAYSAQWGDGDSSYVWDVRADYTVNYTIDEAAESVTFTGETVYVVPEPTSLALLGLGGLIVMRRRRG